MDKAQFLSLMEEAKKSKNPLEITRLDGTKTIVWLRDISRVDDNGITVADDQEGDDGYAQRTLYETILFNEMVEVTVVEL